MEIVASNPVAKLPDPEGPAWEPGDMVLDSGLYVDAKKVGWWIDVKKKTIRRADYTPRRRVSRGK
jgi:hypothetical protein